jgi:uncharacterized protein (DUF1501 family)
MILQRRELLRGAAAAGLSAAMGTGVSGLRGLAVAAEPSGRILVMVHLRGGCDGLNLISPANDPRFIAARAAELRVATDGEGAGIHLDRGLDQNTDFRLHPSAAPLAELYTSGVLAFVHAAGVTDANRSHFVATDMIEHGVGTTAALTQMPTGWLGRYLQALSPQGGVTAVCAGNALSNDFGGWPAGVAVANLDGGFGAPGGAEAAAVLAQLYPPSSTTLVSHVGAETLAAIHEIDRRLSRDDKGKVVAYRPEGAAGYDKAGAFGGGLRTLAQLIKMDLGVTAAAVDLGGWDTHENQPGRFRTCVEQLATGLGTFWNDLSAYHDRLLIVGVTEFGRRLRSNRSTGTDHGRGSVMLALGGAVQGGRLIGRWPGLDDAHLEEGVDLAVTTDYRQVLTEAMAAHAGRAPASAVFPGFTPNPPLGLFTVAS